MVIVEILSMPDTSKDRGAIFGAVALSLVFGALALVSHYSYSGHG